MNHLLYFRFVQLNYFSHSIAQLRFNNAIDEEDGGFFSFVPRKYS